MSLFTTLDVSGSGLSAQRTRVEILAQNIANAETTRTDEGGPYRRRRVTFEAEPQAAHSFRASGRASRPRAISRRFCCGSRWSVRST